MLLFVKISMRLAALVVGLVVMVAVHAMLPHVNVLEAGFLFFVCWLCFSFAVVLLASSWVVGRAGSGALKFGRDKPPTSAEVEALQAKLRQACVVNGCWKVCAPGSRYCIAHADLAAHGGAR